MHANTSKPIAPLPDLPDVWQNTTGWQPIPERRDRFQRLYELVLEGNRQANLTRIIEPQDFWEKHLWDAIAGILLPGVCLRGRAIDIGTGAGFPGLPVAIAFPELHLTLLDATAKKIAFVRRAIEALQLPNADTLLGRAEHLASRASDRPAEPYDLALLRAVAPAAACVRYALPFLKVGGTAILYRGRWTVEEEKETNEAAGRYGGAIANIRAFQTPLSKSVRHCVCVCKN